MDKYDVVAYLIFSVEYLVLIYVLLTWALHPVLKFPSDLVPFLSVIGIAVLTLMLVVYNSLN